MADIEKNFAQVTSWVAHVDFVKCLLFVPGIDILISGGGGSDRDIRLWSVKDVLERRVPKCVGHLRGYHSRGVECLALLLNSDTALVMEEVKTGDPLLSFVSGDSLGLIKVWTLKASKEGIWHVLSVLDVKGHDTSVYALEVGANSEFWSASADKTVRRWRRTQHGDTITWQNNLVLLHDHYVKCIRYIPPDLSGYLGYLLIGSTY